MQEHIRSLMTILLVDGINPLQTTLLELGAVSGRVALLLRSAEAQPVFSDLFLNGSSIQSPPPAKTSLPGGEGRSFQVHKPGLPTCDSMCCYQGGTVRGQVKS
jgi:hypothetical protein